MCKKIIEYLHLKKNKEDNLDGILLGLFPEEINAISKQILKNLGYLISTGVIKESKDERGKSFYRIIDDS